uniref:ATP synthase complex subunit 8 n=1 Tax=Cucujoidea sp. 23 KM-2017 TaxID=2219360 RepID=A0A346RI26_9CUCU|nr:ATP synthase F0 subunit 8 [Cucujoidea sp. 23 KM-2017]
MPQMAPLNWLSLFIFFTVIFLIVNSLNYFMFLYTIKNNNFKKNSPKLNWKW